jgi:hypothetical protein
LAYPFTDKDEAPNTYLPAIDNPDPRREVFLIERLEPRLNEPRTDKDDAMFAKARKDNDEPRKKLLDAENCA